MATAWGREEQTTIAFALLFIRGAILSRKCSTTMSAFWARFSGWRVTKRARAARAFAVSYLGSSRRVFSRW